MAGGTGRWRNDKYYRIIGCYCLTHKRAQLNDFLPLKGSWIKSERELWGQGRREERGGETEGPVQPFRPDRSSLVPAPSPLTHRLLADPEEEYK